MQLFNPLTGKALFSRTDEKQTEPCPLCKKEDCNCKDLTLTFTESWAVHWGLEGEIGGHKVTIPALVFTHPSAPGLEIVISESGTTVKIPEKKEESKKEPELVSLGPGIPPAVKVGAALRSLGEGAKAQVTGFLDGLTKKS